MRSLVALALAALVACTAVAPMTGDDYFRAGKAAQAAGRLEEAAADYEQARAHGSRNLYVAFRLATVRIAQHDNAAAVAELRKASGLNGLPPSGLVDDPMLAALAKDPGFLAYVDDQKRAFSRCRDDAAFHALDFWVGNWTVAERGHRVGTSRVVSNPGECSIIEHWIASGGATAEGYTAYDKADDIWNQRWIASDGSNVEYSGGVKDGAVALVATLGGGVETRLTYAKGGNGTVRQTFEQSADDGKSWRMTEDAIYTRATP